MLILISSLQMWKEDKLMIIMSTRKMTQEERVLDYMKKFRRNYRQGSKGQARNKQIRCKNI